MFLWVKNGQLEYALQANGQLGYVHMGQEGSVGVNKVQIGVNYNYAPQVKSQFGYVLMGQEGSVQIGSCV